MSEVALRRATLDDAEAIGVVLGRAFDDDPVFNWFMRQDEQREEALGTFFRPSTHLRRRGPR